MAVLALAYCMAGFGYIISATFLPVIARSTLADSIWLDLFWPIFGCGVVMGAIGASRLPANQHLHSRLVICYVVQALGIALGIVFPTILGFALGSLLLGLPFTAITYFALQEVRRVRPSNASAFTGLLTATYGVGQIVGPPLTAALVAHASSRGAGFEQALEIAASALIFGAVLLALLGRQAARAASPAH